MSINPKAVGLWLGPLVCFAMLLAGAEQQVMDQAAWRAAAVGLWMAIWWATEAVPVSVTALLPIATFSLLGIANIRQATAPYANPTVYLFMGAFALSLAVQRWNLHRRVALMIVLRTGEDGRRLIGGFMLASAVLSMWMSNTSTTAMLLPIVLSVGTVVAANIQGLGDEQKARFQTALLLGLAYAATIGGLATLIGTPPNALLAAYMAEAHDIRIGFFEWLAVGLPITLLLLPFAWWMLTRRVQIPPSPRTRHHLQGLLDEMGPITTPEKRIGLIFLLVVAGWILRRPLSAALGLDGLSDTGIVIAAVLLTFVVPSGDSKGSRLLTWEQAAKLPWGVLILFGGGLSLASAVEATGLARWLGESLSGAGVLGPAVLLVAATALVILLTELTSNLATAATFLPIMAAIAMQLGAPPLVLCASVTLASSCAFMLPVATPPNAIVFSSGHLTIPQMMRAGAVLNLAGLVLVALVSLWLIPLVLV